MSDVSGLDIEPFSLSLTDPLETATGRIEKREGFLVRLGVGRTVGFGEATPLAGWTESLAACREALEDACESLETGDFRDVLTGIDAEETPAARHGLSSAFADAHARANGEALYSYLGCEEVIERVAVNATVGDGTEESTAEAVQEAHEAGFRTIKLKVGARSIDEDTDRLRAAREVVGPETELRADANGSWNPEEAREAVDSFTAFDLAYIEEPLPGADLDAYAALREERTGVDTPAIALDESLREHSIESIVDADGAEILILKPMVLGGLDRARDAALRAREAGLDVVVTTTIDGAIARAGATHLAASLSPLPACGLATGDRLETDLLELPPVENGCIDLPRTPGAFPTEALDSRTDNRDTTEKP